MTVRLSRYPAAAQHGDRTWERARVVIYDDYALVFTDPKLGPDAIIPLASPEQTPGRRRRYATISATRGGYSIPDAAGGEFTWRRLGGCNCGDPMSNVSIRDLLARVAWPEQVTA